MSRIASQLRAALLTPAWVCYVWFGMTAGVSLLSTTARFAAPLVTRPIALDIGAVTFAMLNKAEFIALIALLVVVRASGRARQWWAICGILALILVAQSAWLLPELTERGAMIAQGTEPPPSIAHAAYSILELLKLLLLFGSGVAASLPGGQSPRVQ